MKAQQTFSILFWISKNRIKNGKAPIYARTTINVKRAEVAVQREVSLIEWDSKSQRVMGKSQEAREINNHLAFIKTKLCSSHSKIEQETKQSQLNCSKMNSMA